VCKGTGLIVNVVVRWAGYCVRAGLSVQGYRVNSAWSCTVRRILCEGSA
jgi:hypothetical protein